MHTLREPLLKKQSCPENGVSADSSPKRSGDVGGRPPQVGKMGNGKKLIIALCVTAVMGVGVAAYENARPIHATVVTWWSAIGSSHKHQAVPVMKVPAAIGPRPAVVRHLVNQEALNYERAAKEASPPPSPLPQWIQSAIVEDDAALSKAQKVNDGLSERVTQIGALNQQFATHVRQLQGTVMSDQARINHLEGRLHALASRQRTPSNATQARPVGSGGTGLVALQAVPPHTAAGVHRKSPERPAKGWVVVAVHGDKAVLQTPGGQVALVKQGQTIGGKTVDGIDDATRTVTLSGGLVAHILGK